MSKVSVFPKSSVSETDTGELDSRTCTDFRCLRAVTWNKYIQNSYSKTNLTSRLWVERNGTAEHKVDIIVVQW